MNKLETNNFECLEMIFFKPNNMLLSFASQNFILKCLSTFEQAQTHITKESSLKKGYRFTCIMTMKHPASQFEKRYNLKAILRLYTEHCMIHRIWVLKQLYNVR